MPAVGSNVVQARNGGTWKNWSGFWAKHSGSWKKPLGVWVRRSGSWVKVWDQRPVATISYSAGWTGIFWQLQVYGTCLTNGFTTSLSATRSYNGGSPLPVNLTTNSLNDSASAQGWGSLNFPGSPGDTVVVVVTFTNASGVTTATATIGPLGSGY